MKNLVLVAAAAAAAHALAASASAVTVPKLVGTVGPGFTITLTKGGKKVTTLKPGRYTFVVTDKSDDHNFHLKGPGIDRVITGLAFRGTKSVTLRLRAGAYTYVCDPHREDMRGSFRVR
jgi:plastocyanin